jgi:hypothetical protein
MEEKEVKQGRGRPRLSPEEKKQRALMRANGELPKISRPDRQVQTDEGDNTKYLRHAMIIREQPSIDTSDPKQVEERIDWYFRHCADSDMKPTVTGFCNSLGVARSTLWAWKSGQYRKGTHEEIILRAYNLLEEMWENYMQNGKINPVAGIFLGKINFQYREQQEYILTPNTASQIDPTTIEAKYAELPDDEE